MKLLAICDTPTENTGFACVSRNLLERWRPDFERIDVWGINYAGWPHDYPYRIYPAGNPWHATKRLERLLNHIMESDYTHVWVMQDLFLLSQNNFPQCLRKACDAKGVKLLLYYPVDAPLEKEWLDIVRVADVAVTYTEWGRQQTAEVWETEKVREMDMGARITRPSDVRVVPHGVDTNVYFPLSESKRRKLRAQYFPKEWQDKKILINVNRNERRKSLVHSLQVLAHLNGKDGTNVSEAKYRLYLHCMVTGEGGLDLVKIGAAFGLRYGRDFLTPNLADFPRGIGSFPAEQLNELYNASDICITTTLGEGWGLSITEAAAAGLPVVGPDNSALPDIQRILKDQLHLINTEQVATTHPDDNARVRYPVDTLQMMLTIRNLMERERSGLSAEARHILDWDNIAQEWVKLF